jgi:linearmycin/streptolysin S transport system permease protein
MRAIWAMVKKDMTLLFRDRMGFFFTFGFPLIMAVFFGTIFAGSSSETREMSVAVVDEDQTPGSHAFFRQLDDGPEFRADSMGLADAREAVRLGKRTAFLVLPKGFAASRQRMFYGPAPEIQLGLDPSRRAEGGMIQGVLTKYMSQDLSKAFAQPESMRARIPLQAADLDSARGLDARQKGTIKHFLGELDQFLGAQSADSSLRAGPGGSQGGWQPVKFHQVDIARVRRGPRNAYEVSFPQGVIWAILSTAFGFALSLVLERTRGTLIRLRVAPIERREILLGKALGCLLTILIVTSVLMVIGALVFHVRPTSLALLAAALVSAAVCFVGIMMIIASISPSQRGVSGLGWAIMMLMSMTGGGMVPLFAMPAWMQSVGSVSPVRWAILALEGSIWRDFTVAQMALPCGILMAIGLVGFVVGTRVFRWTEAA